MADGKIWLTTATVVEASEEEREAKTKGSMVANALEVARLIKLWLIEIDLETGEKHKPLMLLEIKEPQPIHSLNSYASPTPVYENGRLYCHFGAYGTVCVDTKSKSILWNERLQVDHRVGPGSSPVLYKDLLVLTCDGAIKQFISALNKDTGEEVWRSERPPIRSTEPEFCKAFSTPLLIQVDGEDQLVIPGAQWFISYDPANGEEIWRIDHGKGFSNVPRPVFDGDKVFLCSGFMTNQLWAVRPNGRGDLTETENVVWKKRKQIPNMPSPIVVEDRIYTIADGGVARCFDTADGKQIWRERVPGKYSASPLYSGNRIYLCSHEGRTTVFAPGDDYQVLAENDLDGQIMASPVAIDDDLLLRTDTHLYRISE